MEAFATAPDTEALFDQLEAAGNMLRIDRSVRPQMFHYATISTGEVESLRTITNVIRHGRVRAIETGGLHLDDAFVPVESGGLYIDCTASGITRRPSVPVFGPDHITLQTVRGPTPTFSAALTAWVEAHIDDDARKNALCTPLIFPNTTRDYPQAELANLRIQAVWATEPDLRRWIRDSRLDGFGKVVDAVKLDETDKMDVIGRLREAIGPAVANLARLAGVSFDAPAAWPGSPA
jgi:hypothetical protein